MSDRQSTHWEGCWKFDHHEECARARITALEARLAAMRATFMEAISVIGLIRDKTTDDDVSDYCSSEIRRLRKAAGG